MDPIFPTSYNHSLWVLLLFSNTYQLVFNLDPIQNIHFSKFLLECVIITKIINEIDLN